MIGLRDIRECWDFVKPGLEDIRKNWDVPWRLEDVYAACRYGQAFCYVNKEENAFAIVEEHQCQYTLEKHLHIWIAYAYEGQGMIDKYLPELEKLAKQYGYRKITMSSHRPGWRKQPGWQAGMTTYIHEVPE